jgi:hypothetical protein
MDKIEIINEFKNRKCEVENLDLDEISDCKKLTYNTQNEIACFVSSILKKNILKESYNLIEATESLQSYFKLKPLSEPGESEQGITYKVALKGSKLPFAVMKLSLIITPILKDNIIHEITIGLILNNIRNFTPNFMFTYGGFICSPPIDRIRIAKIEEVQNLIIQNISIPKKLKSLYFKLLENIDDDEDLPLTSDKTVFIEYLPTLRNMTVKISHKIKQELNIELIYQVKNELKDILNKTKIYSTQLHSTNPSLDEKELKKNLKIINDMLNNISNVEDEIRNSIEYINSTNSNLSDSLKMLCSTEDKASLLLTEFFDDAIDFGNFVNREIGSKRDLYKIILQVVLSLIIAKKQIGFKHNDLHVGNILIQRNDCTLTYQLNNKVIELESKWIARIIDFGFSEAMFKGKLVYPNFEDEDNKSMYEKKQKKSDVEWIKHFVFNLNKSYFNKLTKDLLFLDTYDEMENFILSNF